MSRPADDHTSHSPLPIDELMPSIVDALRRRRAAVVQAAPGAGKTTRIPPALLAAGLAGPRNQIVMLEPRRVAARAAARRMASDNDWTLGREVGYRIRFETKDSAATRILVVTEGVLLSMLQSDPLLDGIGVVVFDEFHERRLDADVALAMTRRVAREVRPDLAILVMSATLDPGPVADFLGQDGDEAAPVIESVGRAYPVRVHHLAPPPDTALNVSVRAGVARALDEQSGDVLVFLPGVGEIKRAAKALTGIAAPLDVEIVELYGDLASAEQDRALNAGPRRRVVLATNVAETSITVQGVDSVVDVGTARMLRYDPASGLDRLELRRISRAAAEQRAGRAGRLGPGLAIRLWSAHEDRGLRPQEAPEVSRVDLTGAVLQLLAWGEPDAETFPWFEAPKAASIKQALQLLQGLGALDPRGVTRRGRLMARLGLHPRLARLLVAGHESGLKRECARIAALLSERDIVVRSATGPRHAPVQAALESDSDVLEILAALDDFSRSGYGETPAGMVDRGRARHVLRVADHLERRARMVLGKGLGDSGESASMPRRDALLHAILVAYPDRVARRRGERSTRAILVDGRGVRMSSRSAVRAAELFVCVEIAAGHGGERSEAMVFQASAVDADWLAALGPGITETDDVVFDTDRQRIVGRRQRRFGDLILAETERPAGADRAAACLAEAAARDLTAALPLDEPSVAQFRLRTERLREWLPEADLPVLDDDALRALLPLLTVGRRSFAELRRSPLLDSLRGTLDHAALELIEREAPERIALPSGWRQRLRYEPTGPPILAVRIQDLFGVRRTPTVARGRVEVLLHLLAPNMRPQQVTQDLASFWQNTYPLVRKELAGRYPKHAWPDDPLTAKPPTRRRKTSRRTR